MSKGTKFFSLLVAAEILVCGFFFYQKSSQPVPPTPNLSVLDEFTRNDIESEIENVRLAEDWHWLGSIFMANGFYPEAVATFRRASEMDPASSEIAYEFGFCLSRAGDWEEGNRQFQKAIDLNNRKPVQAMFFIGRNYLRGEQPEEAKKAFQKAIKIPNSKFELAKILARQGEFDEADELLKEVALAEHGTVQTFVLRSQIALQQGNRLEAISKSIESEGKWVRIRSPFGEERKVVMATFGALGYEKIYKKSVLQMNDRKHLEARRGYKALQEAEWKPLTQDAWIQLSNFSGRVSEAESLSLERLKRFGPSSSTLNKLGEIYRKSEEHEKALEAWLRGADLQSDEAARDCYRNIATYYLDVMDDEETSLQYQAKGLVLYAYDSLGHESFEETLPMVNMATRYAPDSAEAFFLLGRTKLGLALLSEATAAFQKCLELDPTFGRAKLYLEALEEVEARPVPDGN